MAQLLFTAFSNRIDAVELAHEVGDRLAGEGVTSTLYLFDKPGQPDLDSSTLVVSLGGDGTFLKRPGSPTKWARESSPSISVKWASS